MATQVLDDDTQVERPRMRPRRWWRWVVAALAVALVTGWLWIGTHPVVNGGPVYWNGPGTRVANDGVGDTRLVIDQHEAKFVLSVRNDGVVPFTIRGPADDGPSAISLRMQFGPTEGGLEPLERGSSEVALRPGEAGAVLISVHVDRCLVNGGGGYLSFPVSVRVRQLGITTTQELPTGQEIDGLFFPSDDFQKIPRPSDCPALGDDENSTPLP
ncbi:MAG TPA: hypothetical protein VFX41_02545 [Actinomycetales bacterium]|nr:hypothetical protein [Actinomycetales bacterium]